MHLSEESVLELERLGLEVSSTERFLTINERGSGFDDLEHPTLEVERKDDMITIIHWEWTPGPGPGDFRIKVRDEQEALAFIRGYFFGDNPYRHALREYVKKRKETRG